MKKIYLDQCVVSTLAGNEPQDWRTTNMGSILAAAMAAGTAEVWVSPTHVLETLLCADYDANGHVVPGEKSKKRARIAQVLLELCEGRRMCPSYEFLLVGEFLKLLRQLAPSCIRTDRTFERLKLNSQMVFAGALALLAALPDLDRPEAATPLIRSKLTTQLLHSRFAMNPDGFIDQLIEAATEFRLTSDDLFHEVDSRPLSDLKAEIEHNLTVPRKLSAKARTALEKKRSLVASAYGAVEIGQCLNAVFGDIYIMLMTFDTAELKRKWNALCEKLSVNVSMPKNYAMADDISCAAEPSVAVEGLGQFFRHVSRDALLSPQISQHVILGQLEITLNNGEVPTGGVGFDAEHASILSHMNIFATTDTQLENLAKKAAKRMEKVTRGKSSVQIVTNADQLAKALV